MTKIGESIINKKKTKTMYEKGWWRVHIGNKRQCEQFRKNYKKSGWKTRIIQRPDGLYELYRERSF